MKRDMDLVRQILITIEDYEHGFAPETILFLNRKQSATGTALRRGDDGVAL